MNEWVLVKGCVGIWTNEPCVVITTSLRPCMSYDYIVILVVCWIELPEQRELYPIFMKIWIPINRTQQYDIRSPEIHRNSAG